jgi:hypothetical protein
MDTGRLKTSQMLLLSKANNFFLVIIAIAACFWEINLQCHDILPLKGQSGEKVFGLKVHKRENFLGSDFESCTFL